MWLCEWVFNGDHISSVRFQIVPAELADGCVECGGVCCAFYPTKLLFQITTSFTDTKPTTKHWLL